MNHAQAVDELMREYDGRVPGASVLVLKDGKTALAKSYGFADLENNVTAAPHTNYRLASVTKQFTATAIMILAERELLQYDEPIGRFFLSLPEQAREVTIRHLLTHSSGLIDYEDLIPESATEQVHDADVLKLLETQQNMYFRPGFSYRYSNSGYALLALIVERLSGSSFASFLKREIFEPLGMNGTVAFEEGISSVSNRAFGYSRKDDGWERTDQSVTSAVLGDGGIYSSIDDLVKWDRALADATLVRPESLRQSWTPSTNTDEPGIRYAFGWRISEHRGSTLIWHSGETRGFRNVLVRIPTRHLTVVVLTNRNEQPPYELALRIADEFLN